MTARTINALLFCVIAVAMCCVGGLVGLTGTAAACSAPVESPASTSTEPVVGYDDDQLSNAQIIAPVGADRGIPARGQIIAVAAAIGDSGLRNLGQLGAVGQPLGLFGRRPGTGWGSPAQLIDPVYAAGMFFDKLVTVPHWQTRTLADAAQAVEHSTHPGAYARWEPDATAIVAKVDTTTVGCNGGDGLTDAAERLPAGFSLSPDAPYSVGVAVWWALGQLGTPYHFGGDCTDPHAGTPVAGIADLKPGDLVFIPGSDGTMADPGHVGMCIGHGLLIQAPHTGDTVKLTHIQAWAAQIATIRRVANWG